MKTLLAGLVLFLGMANSMVTELKAEFRKGKTYITFKEDSVSGKSYRIYRSDSPITSLVGKTPLVTVLERSGYDFAFSRFHVIEDLAAPLSNKTGLFVYTPKADQAAYYAVTSVTGSTEDPALISGGNTLSEAVNEEHWSAPAGVLTQIKNDGNEFYIYYYWMDYFDWPNTREYYGNFFNVCVSATIRDSSNVPLHVYLHALNGGSGMPNEVSQAKCYRLNAKDPNNTWWYGAGTDNYTERRILAYMGSVKADPRFSVDTNRVYLQGQSMGGKGTLTLGLNHPAAFAALVPFLAPVDASMMTAVVRNRGGNFPPITDFFGSKDGGEFGMTGHRLLYQTYAAAREGVWGQWLAVGHQPAGNVNTLVQGSFMRFRKDEMFPAFTHSTKDWNYGVPNPSVYDSVGAINSYIDWTSSLHDMGLNNDNLVDCAESLSVTVKSSLTGTVADVTPRRIQRFAVTAGHSYPWKAVDVAADTVLASGNVVADTSGLVTLEAVSLLRTGTRLVIGCGGDCPSANERGNGGRGVSQYAPTAAAMPNPFNPSTLIRVLGITGTGNAVVTIFNSRAQQIAQIKSDARALSEGVRWNAANLPSGIYIIDISISGRHLRTSAILLK